MNLKNQEVMRKEEQFNRELEELMQEFVKKVQEKVLEGEDPKAVTITVDDIEFDNQGRIVIKNPEIVEIFKKWMEEADEVYLARGINFICPGNISC